MADAWPVPIPVKDLLHVQLVYIGTFPEDEREWLGSRPRAFGVQEAMCPGKSQACSQRNPGVRFSVHFAACEEETISILSTKQDQSGSDLITQPGWVKFAHPTKGPQRYEFRLGFHMRNLAGELPGKVVLVAPQHSLFPEI